MATYRRWPKGSWMKLRSTDTLRAIMEMQGFSMSRLARYAGCSKSFIAHLRSGRKTTCTPQLAEKIAEALSVPVDVLFVPYESARCVRNDRSHERHGVAS